MLLSAFCPGEGNGNPLQYSCLENPTDRGAWQATVHGVISVGHDWATKPPPPPPSACWFPRWFHGKQSACQRIRYSVPGLGTSSRRGNGKTLQYYYWENPVDMEPAPWSCKKLTWLSTNTHLLSNWWRKWSTFYNKENNKKVTGCIIVKY